MRTAILLTDTASNPGPLTELAGRPLALLTLRALRSAGIERVITVCDGEAERLRQLMLPEAEALGLQLCSLAAPASGARTAAALRAARPYLQGAALVIFRDVLIGSPLIAAIERPSARGGDLGVVLDGGAGASDTALNVRCRDGELCSIGVRPGQADGVAVGLLAVEPGWLASLDADDERPLPALIAAAARRGGVLAMPACADGWFSLATRAERRRASLAVSGDDAAAPPGCSAPAKPRGERDPQRTLSYVHALLAESNAQHYVLLNPGPVLTSPRVKSALVHYDLCHRDEDFTELVRSLRRKLRRVCGGTSAHDVLLLSGSGTAATEAVLTSCIAPDERLLVVSNGAFGERAAQIAAIHGIPTAHLRYEWGERVDAREIARTLAGDSSIAAVFMCHHETSVGLLNPVRQVGEVTRKLGRLFFVDAVSSLGAEPLDVERDGIDVMIASANKCLHGISGISFVCVDRRVWPLVNDVRPRSFYLDLRRYRDEAIPFTPATSNFLALDAALDDLLQEGVAARWERYAELNGWLRREVVRLGLQPLTSTGQESHSILTLRVPRYVSFSELYQALKRRGYIVYGCKEHLKDRYFQVANMGELSREMVRGFVDALQVVLSTASVRQPALRAV